jgi:hypothetical protein
MLPIKLICGRNANRDGTNPIYIQYCLNAGERTLLNTQVYIPVRHWNKKLTRISKDLPSQYGNPNQLNESLANQIRIAEDVIRFAKKKEIKDEIGFLRKHFQPDFDVCYLEIACQSDNVMYTKGSKKDNLDLYFQIDDYIRSKEKKVCKDMPRIYRNMKEHLLAFESFINHPLTFEYMDLNFYEEFVDFLTYDYVQRRRKVATVGLKVNTIGKTINQLRVFLRNRIRKKIIPPINMDGWKVLQEETDAVYLTMKEIQAIYSLDLTYHPHLVNYRSDFVLGCLTGLRFCDFTDLMLTDIRQDMLHKKQNKSDHWVVIPLRRRL